MGRFLHVPPPFPRSDWSNTFGTPWWKETRYCVGTLSVRTRKIRIINTLTLQEQVIEVRGGERGHKILAFSFLSLIKLHMHVLMLYQKPIDYSVVIRLHLASNWSLDVIINSIINLHFHFTV